MLEHFYDRNIKQRPASTKELNKNGTKNNFLILKMKTLDSLALHTSPVCFQSGLSRFLLL